MFRKSVNLPKINWTKETKSGARSPSPELGNERLQTDDMFMRRINSNRSFRAKETLSAPLTHHQLEWSNHENFSTDDGKHSHSERVAPPIAKSPKDREKVEDQIVNISLPQRYLSPTFKSTLSLTTSSLQSLEPDQLVILEKCGSSSSVSSTDPKIGDRCKQEGASTLHSSVPTEIIVTPSCDPNLEQILLPPESTKNNIEELRIRKGDHNNQMTSIDNLVNSILEDYKLEKDEGIPYFSTYNGIKEEDQKDARCRYNVPTENVMPSDYNSNLEDPENFDARPPEVNSTSTKCNYAKEGRSIYGSLTTKCSAPRMPMLMVYDSRKGEDIPPTQKYMDEQLATKELRELSSPGWSTISSFSPPKLPPSTNTFSSAFSSFPTKFTPTSSYSSSFSFRRTTFPPTSSAWSTISSFSPPTCSLSTSSSSSIFSTFPTKCSPSRSYSSSFSSPVSTCPPTYSAWSTISSFSPPTCSLSTSSSSSIFSTFPTKCSPSRSYSSSFSSHNSLAADHISSAPLHNSEEIEDSAMDSEEFSFLEKTRSYRDDLGDMQRIHDALGSPSDSFCESFHSAMSRFGSCNDIYGH